MRRTYNRKFYKKVRSSSKFARDNFAKDPTKPFEAMGLVGILFGFILKSLIAKPIHFLVFTLVGKVYDKENHHPAIGSVLYTLAFFIVMAMLTVLTRGVVSLF